MTGSNVKRYNSVAMILHWLIFILLAIEVYIGWTHDSLPKDQIGAAMGMHKSIGLSVLILSLFRLAWRVMNPPPPYPASMSRRDKIIMTATHHTFYLLMIGIPLAGWIMTSVGTRPLVFFGLFDFPKLPLSGMKDIGQAAGFAHGKLVWLGIILLILHVAAAIKHQLVDKDNIMARMIPFIK